jgi:hypothetical protein
MLATLQTPSLAMNIDHLFPLSITCHQFCKNSITLSKVFASKPCVLTRLEEHFNKLIAFLLLGRLLEFHDNSTPLSKLQKCQGECEITFCIFL